MEYKHLFIIGSPRSGTTWLQSILSDNDNVATTVETKTFPDYIFPLDNAYEKEAQQSRNLDWPFGLPHLMSEEEFQTVVKTVIDSIYSKIYERNGRAVYILEKHPMNVHYATTILKYLPESKFIHIIRDGREVVASMLKARKNIGFGEKYVMAAAERWKSAVSDGRKVKKLTINYIEIRYEHLLEYPYQEVERVFEFLGLKLSENELSKIVADNKFEAAKEKLKAPDSTVKLNPQHFNSGKKDSWKKELSANERYMVEIVAGPILQELNYSINKWWYSNTFQKYSVPFTVFIIRLYRRVIRTLKFGLAK